MDFSKFQADYCHNGTGVWRTYVFPNGHDASVILDPHDDRPFRFEIESSDPDDLSSGRVVGDLTTEQVEAKLTKLAGLPRNQEEQ